MKEEREKRKIMFTTIGCYLQLYNYLLKLVKLYHFVCLFV